MAKISEKEYKHFSEQLAQRFERKIKGNSISLSLPDMIMGVRLIPLLSAKEVSMVKSERINDNEIYFYTKSMKQGVYNLLRHFRNSASHKDRIKRKQRNGNTYFHFEDRNKSYISMRGNVCVDIWDSFIEELYHDSLANCSKRKQRKEKK